MKEPREFDFVSMYLSQPVLRAHSIHLQLTESRPGTYQGKVRLDPNICGLDLWGDRTGCSKMASTTRDVEATLMRTWDSKGYKRVHYSLQIEGVSERRVHLIAYPRANLWYLTVESESEGTAVVPLFDAEYFSAMSTV
jgi:hypothetical protein